VDVSNLEAKINDARRSVDSSRELCWARQVLFSIGWTTSGKAGVQNGIGARASPIDLGSEKSEQPRREMSDWGARAARMKRERPQTIRTRSSPKVPSRCTKIK
jgi:hypothetical protein